MQDGNVILCFEKILVILVLIWYKDA